MDAILDRHITINPNICHGRPHIDGHRIRVQDVVIWYERLGMSVDEICADEEMVNQVIYL